MVISLLKVSSILGLALLLSGCSTTGTEEKQPIQPDTSVSEPGRLLPRKLRYLPFGMVVEHYPNPCYPEKEGDRYVWKHNTTVRASKDMRMIEYGSFVYTSKGWYLRVTNDTRFFDEHYGTTNGWLKKDSVYADPLSFRYGDTIYAGDAMWYYIAEDKEGNRYKGIGPIETEGITLQELNARKGLSLFSLSETKLSWTGYGEIGGYSLSGTLRLKDGTYRMSDDSLIAANLSIDMQSLDAENKDLVGHLKGTDFFETGKYPVAIFELRKPVRVEDNMNIAGTVMIKNHAEPVEMQVQHAIKQGKHQFTGVIHLDRTRFNIKYNSKSFFSNLGDQAIKNTMDVSFELVSGN